MYTRTAIERLMTPGSVTIEHIMKIAKYFTQNSGPYDGIKFTTLTTAINPAHNEQVTVEYPEDWSMASVKIAARKYLRKTGVPTKRQKVAEDGVPVWIQRSTPANGSKFSHESSIKQIVDRLVGAWVYWGWKGQYFDTEEDARAFYDEMRYMMIRQMGLTNSPQLFNTGLHWAYGINGTPTGKQFYVDPLTDKVTLSESGYARPQPHACFIMSIEDKLIGDNGIQDHWHKEALMFKYGSGVGSNFSNIRAAGEPLSGGGISSGLPSFLLIGDRSAGAVKSGGTTRRAAKMVILDIDHPDIEWFIKWKTVEEDKVSCLISGSRAIARHIKNIGDAFLARKSRHNNPLLNQRLSAARADGMRESHIARLLGVLEQNRDICSIEVFDSDWQGEAYRTVSGQNSNNSVRVSDEFMRLIDTNEDFSLRARVTGEPVKTLKARDLWNEIAYNTWCSADPGIQFHDTINDWHTCPEDGPIRGSNPCSEYMFLDDTACNLASLNLVKFLDDTYSFNTERFEHACCLFTLVLEISIHMAQFPSESIARRSYDFRTLGLGFANIGSLCMRLGLPYDSNEARSLASAITSLMTGVGYKTSSLIAKKLGAFAGFTKNREHMLRVIRNHARAASALNSEYEQLRTPPPKMQFPSDMPELSNRARDIWNETIGLGERYGFRNAQLSVIAPTGTIGLVMDCDTTGCEPDFATVKHKQLAGGGFMTITNQAIPYALKRLGYTPQQIEEILHYVLGNPDTHSDIPAINSHSLDAAGLSAQTISKIRTLISDRSISDLRYAINAIKEEPLFTKLDAKSSILEALGFSAQDIEDSNRFYFGTQTIEGAPHIREKDLPVFDCANTCGPLSNRALHWTAHVKMVAAIQPFVSGSISKTINLPSSASIKECSDSYVLAWQLGAKAVSLYRNGCKSQPLSSTTSNSNNRNVLNTELKSVVERLVYELSETHLSAEQIALECKKRFFAPKRRHLPSKRHGYTQKVYIGGHKLLLRTGEYEDGSLGEIFIDTHKEGATFRSIMNGFAIVFSMALQYGVPLKELVRTFKGTKFEPAGFVLEHPLLKKASSIFSLIAEDLEWNYILKKPQKQTRTNSYDNDDASTAIGSDIGDNDTDGDNDDSNDDSDTEQDLCPSCGSSSVVRTGTCLTCQDCGEGSGCSG